MIVGASPKPSPGKPAPPRAGPMPVGQWRFSPSCGCQTIWKQRRRCCGNVNRFADPAAAKPRWHAQLRRALPPFSVLEKNPPREKARAGLYCRVASGKDQTGNETNGKNNANLQKHGPAGQKHRGTSRRAPGLFRDKRLWVSITLGRKGTAQGANPSRGDGAPGRFHRA